MSTPVTYGTRPTSGDGRWRPPPSGTRSAEQIRGDIVRQRHELSRSVDALRLRWAQATDVKAQLRRHRGELLIGAAVAGALVGGALLFRRRR